MAKGYLTAKQASQKLGISLSTLYAYVSRGLIRSEPDAVKRKRRYRSEDVEALLQRKSQRLSNEKSLAGALSWGEPICESELTLIEQGELFYRGESLVGLLESSTFEEVVGLLWGGYEAADPVTGLESSSELLPLQRFACVLPRMAVGDERAYDLRPESVRQTGSRILATLFNTLGAVKRGEPLVDALARVWCPRGRAELEAALIVSADHELNVSTFTGRCIASSGATPYQVVIGALAAMSGFRHGGYSYRVEALFREAKALSAKEAVHSYLRRGASVPGFGHPLYPQGDPRGRELLRRVELSEMASGLVQAAEELLGEKPNIDFALVALSRSLSLPEGAPVALFTLGRCAGWIAHAIEQYADKKLIRPRARYVGRIPSAG